MSSAEAHQSSSHNDRFCLSSAFNKCFGLWSHGEESQDDDTSVNKKFLSCCCFCFKKQSSSIRRKQPYVTHQNESKSSCNSDLSPEDLSNKSDDQQVGGNTCLEYSKAAAFKGVEAFLSINGEVKSKVDQQHSHLEATNNEKNMAIDVAPINNGNLHEANDNYLPCVEKETDSSADKLKVIYESAQQPHHNIDDVNRSAAVLTERCCDEEITPLLPKDDDNVKKTTCESNNKENNSTASSVSYFRNLVRTERQKLNKPLEYWGPYLTDDESSTCPTHGKDEIRTVIGQTNLVIKERFTQFSRLIDQADRDHEDYKTERPVLMPDLQGFWDMVYFQVEDVTEKFSNLQKLKDSGWERKTTPQHTTKPNTPKTKSTQSKNKKAKPQLSEEDRKRREAARKRIADARKAMAQQRKILRAKTSASDTSVCTMADNLDESKLELKQTSTSNSDIVLNINSTDTTPSVATLDSSVTSLRTLDSVTCGDLVTPAGGGIPQTQSGLVI